MTTISRTIDVRLKRGNSTVRARKGFIAESAQGAERGEGAPRATEPGGVQGTPPIREGDK
jgi:hypothetical protein